MAYKRTAKQKSAYVDRRIAEIRATQSRGTRRGYVYFIGSGDSVKIGFTGDIDGRLAALRTASASDLRLLEGFATYIEAEEMVHSRFASDCLGREWFRLSEGGEIEQLFEDIFECKRCVADPADFDDVFFDLGAVAMLLANINKPWPNGLVEKVRIPK